MVILAIISQFSCIFKIRGNNYSINNDSINGDMMILTIIVLTMRI